MITSVCIHICVCTRNKLGIAFVVAVDVISFLRAGHRDGQLPCVLLPRQFYAGGCEA